MSTNIKVSELGQISRVNNGDLLLVSDIEETGATSKKATVEQLRNCISVEIYDVVSGDINRLSTETYNIHDNLSCEIYGTIKELIEEDIKLDARISANTSKIDGNKKTINELCGYVKTNSQEITGIKSSMEGVEWELSNINSLIPYEATKTNQLADKAFVNSSINSMAASFITKKREDGKKTAFYSYADLSSSQISDLYSGNELRRPTKNDYCIILSDETQIGDDQIPLTTRYLYTKTTSSDNDYDFRNWAFQYNINATAFTAEQLGALNSGINTKLVQDIVDLNNVYSGLDDRIEELEDEKLDSEDIQVHNYYGDSGIKLATITVNDENCDIYTPITGLANVGIGTILPFAGNTETLPVNALLCDGRAVSRITYSDLFGVIGITYGEGDGENTFNLPNINRVFIEGTTIKGKIGEKMSSALPSVSHTHEGSITINKNGGHTHDRGTMEITGYFQGADAQSANHCGGAFYSKGRMGGEVSNSGKLDAIMEFAASKSWTGETSRNGTHTHEGSISIENTNITSDIYGKSDIVQPPSIKMRYVIIHQALSLGHLATKNTITSSDIDGKISMDQVDGLTSEEWAFTSEDGETITKKIIIQS